MGKEAAWQANSPSAAGTKASSEDIARRAERGLQRQQSRKSSEWRCSHCLTLTYLRHNHCRTCGKPSQGREWLCWGRDDGGWWRKELNCPEGADWNWQPGGSAADALQVQHNQQHPTWNPSSGKNSAAPWSQRPAQPKAAPKLVKAAAAAAAAAAQQQQQRSATPPPAGGTPARPWGPPRGEAAASAAALKAKALSHAERARALAAQAQQLKAIGASPESVALLMADSEMAWEEHRRSKPIASLGKRLDEARSKLAKAEAAVQRSGQVMVEAVAKHEAAMTAVEEAHAAYEEVAGEAAAEQSSVIVSNPTLQDLASATARAIAWIESHAYGPPGSPPPPEALLQHINKVKESLESLSTLPGFPKLEAGEGEDEEDDEPMGSDAEEGEGEEEEEEAAGESEEGQPPSREALVEEARRKGRDYLQRQAEAMQQQQSQKQQQAAAATAAPKSSARVQADGGGAAGAAGMASPSTPVVTPRLTPAEREAAEKAGCLHAFTNPMGAAPQQGPTPQPMEEEQQQHQMQQGTRSRSRSPRLAEGELDFASLIRGVYAKYKPDHPVEALLAKYRGHEAALYSEICTKYGERMSYPAAPPPKAQKQEANASAGGGASGSTEAEASSQATVLTSQNEL